MTRLDIHASKDRDDVWIMYDTAFEHKVVELEYNPKTRRLFFLFENDDRRPLGALITDDLADNFNHIDEMTLYHVEITDNEKKILGVQDVPFFHIEADYPEFIGTSEASVDPKDLSENFGKVD